MARRPWQTSPEDVRRTLAGVEPAIQEFRSENTTVRVADDPKGGPEIARLIPAADRLVT